MCSADSGEECSHQEVRGVCQPALCAAHSHPHRQQGQAGLQAAGQAKVRARGTVGTQAETHFKRMQAYTQSTEMITSKAPQRKPCSLLTAATSGDQAPGKQATQ